MIVYKVVSPNGMSYAASACCFDSTRHAIAKQLIQYEIGKWARAKRAGPRGRQKTAPVFAFDHYAAAQDFRRRQDVNLRIFKCVARGVRRPRPEENIAAQFADIVNFWHAPEKVRPYDLIRPPAHTVFCQEVFPIEEVTCTQA